MLRINLLRDLEPSSPSAPEIAKAEGAAGSAPTGGTLRPVLVILLGLLILGAAALYLAKPAWLNLERFTGLGAKREAQADSLRMEALRAEASRLVARHQSLAIEWLDQIEAILPPPSVDDASVLTLSSFTASGAFILRGTVATAEDLSAIQEALILIPGMDLRQSRADELETLQTGFSFAFSGTVDLPVDTVPPPGDRVVSSQELEQRLAALVKAAALEGVAFSTPQKGAVVASGALRLQPYRLTGTLDSVDSIPFSALRNVLAAERHRQSPFGVQRVTLNNHQGRNTVFLDIMAYTP